MKKLIIVLIAGAILLNFHSCARETEGYSIRDALKISTWVLDEYFERSGYWVKDDNTSLNGYWMMDDGERIEGGDVFTFERLKMNEVRTLAPLHYHDMGGIHINIFFEFDGIIEVETNDRYVVLYHNGRNPSLPLRNEGGLKKVRGNVRWPRELYVNFCPLDEYSITEIEKNTATEINLVRATTQISREYYLNVNAYRYEDTIATPIIDTEISISIERSPIIRAKLKLTVIEDRGLSANDYYCIFGLPYKEASRFLSIELVSYEYSDIYRFLDEIWDDEKYD